MKEELTWEAVEPAAEAVFHVWVRQPELQWAKQAWEFIVKAGLASYANELERHEVAIRFFALAAFYQDFCEVAWDVLGDGEYLLVDALESLEFGEAELAPFRIGQLVGRDSDAEDAYEALWFLVKKARDDIFDVLLAGFGARRENPTRLFISLWKSSRSIEEDTEGEEEDTEGEEDLDEETDWDIVNDVTGEKLAGFAWLREGAYPLH